MQHWIKSLLSIFIVALLVLIPLHQCFANPSILPLVVGTTDEYGLIFVKERKDNATPIADFIASPKEKSPTKAFVFSAVVPGSGELYIGAKRGIAFIAAEIAFWSAYIVLNGRADDLRSDYVSYVDEHIAFEPDSPATSTKDWTLEDYEHATQADNWHYVYTDNAGKPVDKVGKFYWKDLPEELINENGEVPLSKSNSNYRVVAYGKRSSANAKYKQAKRYLSIVVVNHIASAIDARIAAMIRNKKASQATTNIRIRPSLSADDKLAINLNISGNF